MATEAFRKDVSRQLTELQDGIGPAYVTFPASLSSEERKYVHNLCQQFGLKSKSKGSGAKRYLTVSRKHPVVNAVDTPNEANGAAAAPITRAQGKPLPVQLPQQLARIPCFSSLPTCPQEWNLTGPADARCIQIGSKAFHGGSNLKKMKTQASRAVLDEAEASRLASSSAYASLQAKRRNLPAWAKVDEVLAALKKSRVVLIAGETGCGKSTQIPQFLLDGDPKSQIVVTQPRRIAAVSLAQRVAEERCETLGGTVGYSIHMEHKTSKDTRCTFCTTGVFRRRLLSDPRLPNLTHIVVDEVHERELHSDFLLIILKELLEERKDLRLVLMSATLQLEIFQQFFTGCTTVQIPGRTFPVHRLHLEEVVATLFKKGAFRPFLGPAFAAAGQVADEKKFKQQVSKGERHPDQVCGYGQFLDSPMTKERLLDGCEKHDLLQQARGTYFDIPIIDALILHLDQEHKQRAKQCPELPAGAILVFFPGWGDIDHASRRLRESLDASRFLVLPCHSQVRPEQQREIFKVPPKGVRKIILASNIAETSITVEDVMVVIDTGRAKETSYDPYLKVGTLATTFISKASAAQRAGRAGRTKEGICFHLFSKKRHSLMEEFRAPELLRSPLEDVCLHTAHLLASRRLAGATFSTPVAGGDEIAEWLTKAPQAPEAIAVTNAVELLKVLGALTSDGAISRLGVKLANLPLPVTMARSVVWGALLGCLEPVLTIIAAASGRDPFQLPQDPSGGGRQMGGRGGSFPFLSSLLRRKKKDLCSGVESDHYAVLRAVELFENEKRAAGEAGANRLCERYSLSRRGVQAVIEMREKMKQELKQQRLLNEEVLAFANRHSSKLAVILAVVTSGVFPNLAVRRPGKKKLEVNSGRLDATTHPQSVLDSGGQDDGKGKGKSKQDKGCDSGTTEWLCYTEMTQVEQRYSMSGMSRVSPIWLLLLCGDEPFTVTGSGADVAVTLLGGWVDFVVPRDQAQQLQNLRFALRKAFLSYCDVPARCAKQLAVLDCAVQLLENSVDATGKPSAWTYTPAAAPRTGGLGPLVPGVDPSVPAACPSVKQPLASGGQSRDRQEPLPHVAPGMEKKALLDLQRKLNPSFVRSKAYEVEFQARSRDRFRAYVTLGIDGSKHVGEWAKGKKAAEQSAVRAAIAFLSSGDANESADEQGNEISPEEPHLPQFAEQEEEEPAEEVEEILGEEEDAEEETVEFEVDKDMAAQCNLEDHGIEDEEGEEGEEEDCEGNHNQLEGAQADDLEGIAGEDEGSSAALRFLLGDTNWQQSVQDLPDVEEADALAIPKKKRRRIK